MDYLTYLWFRFLDSKCELMDQKLDLILQTLNADQAKLADLAKHVRDKAAALQVAIDANKPQPS